MANIRDVLENGINDLDKLRNGDGSPGSFYMVGSGSQEVIASDLIRTPVAISPVTGTSGVATNTTLSAGAFASAFTKTRDFRRFEVRALGDTDWLTLIFSEEIDANTSSTISPLLAEDSAFEWRCRDVAVDGTMSDWMVTQSFTTGNAFIVTPTVDVEGEPSDVPEAPVITTSEFATVGDMDTHLSTDWEVRLQSDNSLVYSSVADTVNLTSIQVPEGFLLEDTTYVFRARHNGTTLPPSAYGEKIATTELEFFKALAVLEPAPQNLTIYNQDDATFIKTGVLSEQPFSNTVAEGSIAFSADGLYLAVSNYAQPVYMYHRSGNVFTRISTPELIFPNQAGGRACAFSADSNLFAIAYDISPYFSIFNRVGNVFTKINGTPSTQINDGKGIVFSDDDQFLAITTRSSANPGAVGTRSLVSVFHINGNTYTLLDRPNESPAGIPSRLCFSAGSQYLAVANESNVVIYHRNGNTFTLISDILVASQALCRTVSFSPDSNFLAVSHTQPPNVTIYSRSGNVFTKVPDPDVLPSGPSNSVSFSSDGLFLAVGHRNNPYVTIYSRSGNLFTKVADPDVIPLAGNAFQTTRDVAFYPPAVPGSR